MFFHIPVIERHYIIPFLYECFFIYILLEHIAFARFMRGLIIKSTALKDTVEVFFVVLICKFTCVGVNFWFAIFII